MTDSHASHTLATTRWSVVVAAGQRASPESQKALTDLCQTYWPAVYVFVRRQVGDRHDAQDLTQAFFAQMLEKNAFAVLSQARCQVDGCGSFGKATLLVGDGDDPCSRRP